MSVNQSLTDSATCKFIAPKETPEHVLQDCQILPDKEEICSKWVTLQDKLVLCDW